MNSKFQSLRKALLSLSVSLSACSLGPNFITPETRVPEAFLRGNAEQDLNADLTQWWKGFKDPILDDLISRANQENLTLKQALARIEQARASSGIAFSTLLPSLDASGSFSKSRSSSGQSVDSNQVRSSNNSYRAGFDAAWELDLFGKNRREYEASSADFIAAIENSNATRVSIFAEVASTYVSLRSLQKQYTITKENQSLQQQFREVTCTRAEAGFEGISACASSRADEAQTGAQISLLEGQVEQQMYALSLLLGKYPSELLSLLQTPTEIPNFSQALATGILAQLLSRRPDVREAEARLHAAVARVGGAIGELFPTISLSYFFGFQSNDKDSFLNLQDKLWQLGTSVFVPIFEGGRLQSNVELREAIEAEALHAYQLSVLTALKDVESALVSIEKESARKANLDVAHEQSRRAYDASLRLYRDGLGEFLEALTNERSLLSVSQSVVKSEEQLALNKIALYKALGGGW